MARHANILEKRVPEVAKKIITPCLTKYSDDAKFYKIYSMVKILKQLYLVSSNSNALVW